MNITHHPIKDLSGTVFGRLTVVSLNRSDGNGKIWWNCICVCGAEAVKRSDHMKSGLVSSCGCLQRGVVTSLFKTHGEARPCTLEYSSWQHMKSRCLNPRFKQYASYGGRGISVCNRWINSYETFLSDMGRAPSVEYTLDRIDVDGPYTKDNCRWATNEQQHNNKRNNIFLEYNGIVKSLSQWSRFYGIPRSTADQRFYKNFPFHKIFNLDLHEP